MTCPTCGFLLGDKQLPYEKGVEKIEMDEKLSAEQRRNAKRELLDSLQLTNYCCRTNFITYVPLEKVMK